MGRRGGAFRHGPRTKKPLWARLSPEGSRDLFDPAASPITGFPRLSADLFWLATRSPPHATSMIERFSRTVDRLADGLPERWMNQAGSAFSFRKEVIQPQVPLRLPCYDLVPIAEFILGAGLLAVTSATSDAPHFRGLTGGVYKAQEHIHRGMLTRDY